MELSVTTAGEVATRTLSDRVGQQLINAIVSGELPAGTKISEAELAKTYGVSRGPLREAIRKLESLRLIERKAHIGARVVKLSAQELIDIYQVREALEGMACRLAAQHMSDTDIQALFALLDQHEVSVEEQAWQAYFQKAGDLDFHYRIVRGSGNAMLLELLGADLYHLVRMYRTRFSVSQYRPKRALKEHRQIVDAIASRDAELAELLMRRHISAARQNIAQQLNPSQETPHG
ncbi:MAG: GntR family transcriptional regulator [Saccharospirillum sp.]